MSLWSELETLGQNATSVFCAQSRTHCLRRIVCILTIGGTAAIHTFDENAGLQRTHGDPYLTTHPSVALKETCHDRNRPIAANSQPRRLTSLRKLHFCPPIHVSDTVSTSLHHSQYTHDGEPHELLDAKLAHRGHLSLHRRSSRGPDDGEEDDKDHISFEECDNLGGEKGCSGFGIRDARAYLAQ
jgi:hypothetical protein